MSERELQEVKAEIQAFDASHNTREECLKALQKAGIADSHGQLAEPYRTAAQPPKKK